MLITTDAYAGDVWVPISPERCTDLSLALIYFNKVAIRCASEFRYIIRETALSVIQSSAAESHCECCYEKVMKLTA